MIYSYNVSLNEFDLEKWLQLHLHAIANDTYSRKPVSIFRRPQADNALLPSMQATRFQNAQSFTNHLRRRPSQPSLTPLQSALPQNAPVTPSESALARKDGGGCKLLTRTDRDGITASCFLRSPSVLPNTDWRLPAPSLTLRWCTQIPRLRGPHGST
jgi:hypothetical protein